MHEPAQTYPNSKNEDLKKVTETSLRTALEQEWQPTETSSDTHCLYIFLVTTLCLLTLTAWDYLNGDPNHLMRGWDVYGQFCGEGDREDRSYTVFPTPLTDLGIMLCFEGCPAVTATEGLCVYDQNGNSLDELGCYDAYPSSPFHDRYCLPADRPSRNAVLSFLMQPAQVMTRVTGDIVRVGDM